MKAYEQELRDRANKIRLEEMNQALENTKKIAGAYKYSTKVVREDENGEIVQLSDAEDEVELEERIDVVELISDNQVLLNRVDQLLIENKEITVDQSYDQSSEVESLTDSLIDGLYKQIKT